MATSITLNGVSYSIPADGDEGWGSQVSTYLIALSTGVLSKAGGSFTLTADVDFGANYGLKALYLKSRAPNPSSAGILRLGNAESVGWRNAGNSADLLLKANASNRLEFDSVAIPTISSTDTLTNKTIAAGSNTITGLTNAAIDAAAAIAYSKLNLSSSIVNADISNAAAIAYSKLNLSSSIVNADVSASAAIAYSKLNLSSSIVNADVSASAAIAYSKLNLAGSVNLASDMTGTLPIANGGTGQTSQTAAFDALAPTTTNGDMILRSAGSNSRLAVGSSGQVLKVVGGAPTWATFSGGINYLSSNPDAESDTNGWATYADAAASTPVNGTGGSANITWTRTTSSPLRGSGSFLLTKDAANRQGEGTSFDFTIDDADKAKVLSVSFDYEIGSGTYADGDLTLYLYDVTNSLLIQPSGYSILNTGVEAKHIATFQTASSSTSYRLILHVASTSASAYTVKLDNFQVGPQTVQYGATVSDWTSFTMSIEGSTSNPTKASSPTEDKAYWRRVGDSMEITYSYRHTSNVGAAAGSGNYLFKLPTGYSIDSNKVDVTSLTEPGNVGSASGYASGGTGTGYVKTYDSTHLALVLGDEGIAPGLVGSAFYELTQGTLAYSFKAVVPIQGWSSNVQMSDSTDTRVVAFRARKNSGSHTSTGNWQDITSWTTDFDTHGAFNATTGEYTVKVPGKYRATASITYGGNATGQRSAGIAKNGTREVIFGGQNDSASYNSSRVASGIFDCVAGDVLKPQGYQDSGGNLAFGASSEETSFSVERLSGPSAIAASEPINCKYYGNAGQSISTGTLTDVTFATKVYDSHGAFNGTTFTAPTPGIYEFTAATYMVHSGGTITGPEIELESNNGEPNVLWTPTSSTTNGNTSLMVTASYRLLAGQTVKARVYHASGASRSLGNDNRLSWFTSKKTGNY